MPNENITITQLKSLLHYDPQTGLFRWIAGQPQLIGRVAGSPNRKGYIIITIARIAYRAHNLAWFYMTGAWPKGMLDHRDVRPENNRFDNLREATLRQNLANRRPLKRIKHPLLPKGVRPSQTADKFCAEIYRNGRRLHLGTFSTAETAAAAYAAAAVIEFGEFARTS